jgi:hypothetical protein
MDGCVVALYIARAAGAPMLALPTAHGPDVVLSVIAFMRVAVVIPTPGRVMSHW